MVARQHPAPYSDISSTNTRRFSVGLLLKQRLFRHQPDASAWTIPQPDWAYVHAEVRRKGVTLALLWEEYRGVYPDGYGCSRYCELYTRWAGILSPLMR
ncbi:hypothetical protein [Aliiroseovarius sp. 2305UL8-7]|uniref:hypothetical protein n=1 Tax=Aliiroseovarius conchicola TaxID=3121637 RepID=UPI00352924F7